MGLYIWIFKNPSANFTGRHLKCSDQLLQLSADALSLSDLTFLPIEEIFSYTDKSYIVKQHWIIVFQLYIPNLNSTVLISLFKPIVLKA